MYCTDVLVCSFIHNDLEVAMVGPKLDLTYEYEVSWLNLLEYVYNHKQFLFHLLYQKYIFL